MHFRFRVSLFSRCYFIPHDRLSALFFFCLDFRVSLDFAPLHFTAHSRFYSRAARDLTSMRGPEIVLQTTTATSRKARAGRRGTIRRLERPLSRSFRSPLVAGWRHHGMDKAFLYVS